MNDDMRYMTWEERAAVDARYRPGGEFGKVADARPKSVDCSCGKTNFVDGFGARNSATCPRCGDVADWHTATCRNCGESFKPDSDDVVYCSWGCVDNAESHTYFMGPDDE